MGEIFRKEVLERLSSPERLDQLMQVVRPKNWLVLSTFVALVVVALLWSILGRLPTMVVGRGVLIRPRKVLTFQAPSSGRLTGLAIQTGDVIKPGEVLGTIDQAEMRQRLLEEQEKLTLLLSQDQTKSKLQSQQTQLQIERNKLEQQTIQLQRQDLQKRLRDAKAKEPLLQQRVASRRELERKGLLPENSTERLQEEQAFRENQDKVAELASSIQQLASKLKQLETQQKDFVFQNLEASTSRKNQMQDLQSRIDVLKLQLTQNSQIVSRNNGRILELTVNAGQLIQEGQRLGSIQLEDGATTLAGVTYFPIRAGKKVQPGMRIQIAPDTVERERYGSLLGTVVSVSAFPVTREGIANLVGNPEVVAELVAGGPPIEVVADLEEDPLTFSDYKWSSSAGPDQHMTSGTTTVGRVAVEYRAPITYLLPFLREISGVY